MAVRLVSGGEAQPRLRLDMNLGTLWELPFWSSAPTEMPDIQAAMRALRVEAVQGINVDGFVESGFGLCGMGRVVSLEDADRIAADHKSRGFDLTTLHVGDGMESDGQMDAFAASVIEASSRHGYPLFIETHRATITQDIRRTIDLIDRFPDLRFNADLSHWYTGQEMTYGDFDARLRMLEPFFDRVRYMHGRVGDPGSIQRSPIVTYGEPFLDDFRRMWRACFRGFLRTAGPGEVLPFAPELLPHSVQAAGKGKKIRMYYARVALSGMGRLREESDRWADAIALLGIARTEFDAVAGAVGHATRRESQEP